MIVYAVLIALLALNMAQARWLELGDAGPGRHHRHRGGPGHRSAVVVPGIALGDGADPSACGGRFLLARAAVRAWSERLADPAEPVNVLDLTLVAAAVFAFALISRRAEAGSGHSADGVRRVRPAGQPGGARRCRHPVPDRLHQRPGRDHARSRAVYRRRRGSTCAG